MCPTALPSSPPLRARGLVLSLAQELRTLQRLVGELPAAAPVGSAGVALAQNQDLVEQTLGELADFLAAAGPSFADQPLRGLQPALDAIRLAALAERLGGTADATREADGEMELL